MNRNITATVLIILAIGIYFTVTSSILSDAGKVQTVNAQYISAINTAKQTIQLQNKVVNDYNSLSAADKDRLSKMVPSSVDNIRLIIDLNNVASQHNLSLQNITATAADQPGAGVQPAQAAPAPFVAPLPNQAQGNVPTITAPTLDTVAITFSVTAPYLGFTSFLKDLEADLRIMDVTHLSMTATDNGVYTFQVGLQTYWLRQQ